MNILIVVGVFILVLIATHFWQKKQQQAKIDRFEFIKKHEALQLNPRQKLHLLLQQILSSEYRIHCQVSLAYLISAQDKLLKRNSLSKLMDFVITDKNNAILAVIELDTRAENERKNDWVLACLKGQHSFIRIPPQQDYNLESIAEHLQTVCGLAIENRQMS
ncbi:DUF2726 domain-containing protein [Catenovulum adriaticum]|uniref:DUF2726 domain-containing protein n=1 Tax=Catenovulum adriaticum TaxID=2984846 RepID=A0ABY7AHZ9_9ALTE|nr:DUF2726 domain-containing protein [Catenovulum sp. TS8]WAJ69228.1 DUF2726 domain-containing protein [Catenovulum sp. TS8]